MEKQQYNTSTKPLLNTATGEPDNNPVDKYKEYLDTEYSSPLSNVSKTGNKGTVTLTADPEFTAGIPSSQFGSEGYMSAAGQGWWSKFGRTLGRGAAKGLVGAIDPLTSGIGSVLSYIDEESGKYLEGFTETAQEGIDDSMKVHEKQLDEDASFGDKLFRFSTLESIVKSATEFGVMGMGVGFTTRAVGHLAVKGGASLQGVSRGVAGVLDKTGRALSKPTSTLPFKMFGKNIHTSTVVNGFITNHLEGRVMADETRKELEKLYEPILYNSEISQEDKDNIRAQIDEAGTRVIATNTALAITDIIGFSRLFRYSEAGVAKPGFWNYMWNNIKPLSVTEGLEEITQSILQTDAEFQAIQDIEAEAKSKVPQRIEGLEYTGDKRVGEDMFLWQADPAKAEEITFMNAKSTIDRLIGIATSDEALIEGVAGLVGGGPQWMITGSVSAIKNRKANKENYEAQENLKKEAAKDFQGFVKESLLDEAALNRTLEDLQERFEGTDKEHLAKAVENYSMAKLAKDAVEDNRQGGIEDLLHTTRKGLDKDLRDGVITQEEYDKYKGRLETTQKYIDKFYKLKSLHGSSQILAKELKKVAIEEALASIETTTTKVDETISKMAGLEGLTEEQKAYFEAYNNRTKNNPIKIDQVSEQELKDKEEAAKLEQLNIKKEEALKTVKPAIKLRKPTLKQMAKAGPKLAREHKKKYDSISDRETRLKKLIECL